MSEINPFVISPYKDDLKSRVTEQFKESPVFHKYLDLLTNPSIELQETFKDLMQKRSIHTATGAVLDLIGEIVGQPRELIDIDILEFFGFQYTPNAGSMGDAFDSSIGAVFFSSGQSTKGNIVLSDDMYRLFIRAKIAKNVTRATPEDIMSFCNFIFETSGSTVQDEGNAAFRLYIGKELGTLETALLRYIRRTASYESALLPKPIGVRVNYGSFDYNSFFAFAGVPNAKGFGTLDVKYYDGMYNYDGTIRYFPELITDEEKASWYGSVKVYYYDGTEMYDGVLDYFPKITAGIGGKLASIVDITN